MLPLHVHFVDVVRGIALQEGVVRVDALVGVLRGDGIAAVLRGEVVVRSQAELPPLDYQSCARRMVDTRKASGSRPSSGEVVAALA